MKSPKFILDNGTLVTYNKDVNGEIMEFNGIIIGNGLDKCVYRSKKDLVYYVQEEGQENHNEYDTIHHQNLYENILCPSCKCDMLEVGIDEQVWITRTYDRELQEECVCFNPVVGVDRLQCSYCHSTVSKDNINKLLKYLDI